MNPTEQFSNNQAGMKARHLAEALGIKYETILSIFSGKYDPTPGLLSDLVQLEHDVAYWVAYFKANPNGTEYFDAVRDYRAKRAAMDIVENNN